MSDLLAILDVTVTDLVAGEDPLCCLSMVNRGPRTVEVPNLDMNQAWPQFFVEDLASGVRQCFTPAALGIRSLPTREGDGPWLTLEPGATCTWPFSLSHRIVLPSVGRFRVHAAFPSGGVETGSAPVELAVEPAEWLRSDLSYSHGGFANEFFEAWVGTGYGLYLRAVRVKRQVRQQQCLRLARLPRPVLPQVSVAPQQACSETRCVSWLQSRTFYALDVGASGIVGSLHALPLSGEPHFLVAHPWKDPDSDETFALAWTTRDRESQLQPIHVGREAATASAPVSLSVPEPVWMRSFHPSTGERHGLFACVVNGQLTLFQFRHADGLVVSERPLAAWDWSLLGLAAHLDSEDVVRGVLVGQRLADGPDSAMWYATWSLDQPGRLSVDQPRIWATLDPHEIEHFQVEIDGFGAPRALVRSPDGQWSCVGPETGQVLEVPEGVATSDLPILRFIDGGSTAIAFWHDPCRGLVGVPVGAKLFDPGGAEFVQPPFR
jgi:hypothetical protein